MKNKNYAWAVCLLAVAACQSEENQVAPNPTPDVNLELAYPNHTESNMITYDVNGTTVHCNDINGEHIFEGDIILTDEQLQDGEDGIYTEGVGLRGRRWSNGIVYYRINSRLPNKARVTDAIAHWESRTSLRFRRRTNQRDYIEFVAGSGCSSSIGRVGGRQRINLASGCSTGNTIHEIGHAVGLFHEQSRNDRDNFVIIRFENIQRGRENNFRKAGRNASDYTNTLDFGSIMMYPPTAFSRNGRPTIEKRNGGTYRAQRRALSSDDIAGIERMY